MAVHTIYITRDCSMNCSYCYEENKIRSHISISRINLILKKIYLIDANPDMIEVFGGEPLLNWKIFQAILKFCNDRKTPLITSTNGLHLTTDKINILKQYNILVGISYDGQTTHDVYRKTNNNSNTEQVVRESIIKSIGDNLNIIINMTLQIANANSLINDIENLYNLGVRKIQIHNVNHNQYAIGEEERNRILVQALLFAKNKSMDIYLKLLHSRSTSEHYYYYDTVIKKQQKGTLGNWATVGWD